MSQETWSDQSGSEGSSDFPACEASAQKLLFSEQLSFAEHGLFASCTRKPSFLAERFSAYFEEGGGLEFFAWSASCFSPSGSGRASGILAL